MHVGCMPDGALYDAQFHGLSAEVVYDRSFSKQDGMEKLRSGDLLYGKGGQGTNGEPDDFYRRALQRGLQYHESSNRGFLPAGLIEEIHALSMPPIPWDVQLGTWFVRQFPHNAAASLLRQNEPQAKLFTGYSKTRVDLPVRGANRKDIRHCLDTSGSMSRALLAAALGSISSYSAARRVHAVRLVFCDAAVYDQVLCRRSVCQKQSMYRDAAARSCSRESIFSCTQRTSQKTRRFWSLPMGSVSIFTFTAGRMPICCREGADFHLRPRVRFSGWTSRL